MIGQRPALGFDLGPMPPVVVLSACSVAPRGKGPVSIADLLLREGATAVLGTVVPVDVRHNATLMLRLLLYFREVLAGREQQATLLEIWHRAQASNAVHDVLSGSGRLMEWGHRPRGGLQPPMVEFKNERAAGIRLAHVYTDTERILVEIATDRGEGEKVANWMRNPGYMQESAFYVLLGEPDRIRFRPPDALPPSQRR